MGWSGCAVQRFDIPAGESPVPVKVSRPGSYSSDYGGNEMIEAWETEVRNWVRKRCTEPTRVRRQVSIALMQYGRCLFLQPRAV